MDIQSLSNNALASIVMQRPQSVAPDGAGLSPSSGTATQDKLGVAVPAEQGNSISREQLNSAVKATKDFVGTVNSSLEFSVDDDTGSTVVKILDKETKEVIRQIPSEEMLSIAKALDTIKGLLLHQKA